MMLNLKKYMFILAVPLGALVIGVALLMTHSG